MLLLVIGGYWPYPLEVVGSKVGAHYQNEMLTEERLENQAPEPTFHWMPKEEGKIFNSCP